jgi:hypothetical protein
MPNNSGLNNPPIFPRFPFFSGIGNPRFPFLGQNREAGNPRFPIRPRTGIGVPTAAGRGFGVLEEAPSTISTVTVLGNSTPRGANRRIFPEILPCSDSRIRKKNWPKIGNQGIPDSRFGRERESGPRFGRKSGNRGYSSPLVVPNTILGPNAAFDPRKR